jgi:uncharacterized protein YlxP (DUF503 family)
MRTPDVRYILIAEVDGEEVYKSEHYAIDMIEEDLLDAEKAVNNELNEIERMNYYGTTGKEYF